MHNNFSKREKSVNLVQCDVDDDDRFLPRSTERGQAESVHRLLYGVFGCRNRAEPGVPGGDAFKARRMLSSELRRLLKMDIIGHFDKLL